VIPLTAEATTGALVLAIETSCDETAVAIARGGRGEILASEISSQIALHQPYGGVVPELASRNHNLHLRHLIGRVLAAARITAADLDAVAATAGPGLASSLLIGNTTAKAIALALRKPFYAINHLEGHLLSPFIGDPAGIRPNLSLVVSGGHTLLVHTRGAGDYTVLGSTRDDAAGEAFDKVGKMLGLPYPGGPEIDRRARQGGGDAAAFDLPRSMIGSGDFQFSFSGLKTSVFYLLQKLGTPLAEDAVTDLCASFQEAVVEILVAKTLAAAAHTGERLVTVSGGVSCNTRLREMMAAACESRGLELLIAAPAFCTDNAADRPRRRDQTGYGRRSHPVGSGHRSESGPRMKRERFRATFRDCGGKRNLVGYQPSPRSVPRNFMNSRSFFPSLVAFGGAAAMASFLALAQDAAPEKQQSKAVTNDEFVSLFDGQTLKGWDGDPKLWRVEDGAITGETKADAPIPYNTFLKWTQGELDDFELTVEYRIFSGNSGIQVRSFESDKPYSIGGYQADFDAGGQWAGTTYGEKYRGVLAKRGEKTVINEDGKPEVTGRLGDPAELATVIKKEEWNTYRIIARGHKIVCEINGTTMSEVVDNDTDTRRRAGLLAFQLHAGPPMKVQFRNIRLKRLPLGDVKKIVYVAGAPSHAARQHEHNAGALLAKKLLNEHHGDKVLVATYLSGWPADQSAFQNADAMVIQSDGGPRHPAFWHLRQIDYLREQGVGVGMIHYAVEMVPGESNDTLIAATGGAFEVNYSVNPHWDGGFKEFPEHPVARGVKPFTIRDEWYFNMRFTEGMKGVTPILSAVPPDETMSRPDGHHSGNPEVRRMVAEKQAQHVCWVIERPEGGRGFGFTGLHFHDNWADDNFRKTVLNAISWIARVEIPAEGIATPTPTQAELDANLDPKPAPKPKPAEAPKKSA
jgi:tRNA threonylcarbamoyl adenosine modification protein TsaD